MDFGQKIDALDLIIEVLKEHERELDDKIGGLDGILTRLEGLEPRKGTRVPVRITRHGNSIGVNFPKLTVDALGLKVGDIREITIE